MLKQTTNPKAISPKKPKNFQQQSWYDKGFEICVWLILLLTPLSFTWVVFSSYELVKGVVFQTLLYAALFFFLWRILWASKINIPAIFRNRIFLMLLVVVPTVFILSTIFSIEPILSFWGSYPRQQGLYMYLHYFAFSLMVLLSFNQYQYRRSLMIAFIALGITTIYGIAQSLGLYIGNWNVDTLLGRVFATFGHPNHFSLYIVILFFPLLGFLLRSNQFTTLFTRSSENNQVSHGKTTTISLIKFALPALLIMLSLISLFLTKGRASILGLIVGFAFFMTLLAIRYKKKSYALIAVIPIILTISLTTIANLAQHSTLIKENQITSRLILNGENLRSIETRLTMWPSVIEMSQEKPLLGHGMETFAQSYAPYMDSRLLLTERFGDIPDRAHNSILQWLSDFGYLGVTFLLALMWLTILTIKTEGNTLAITANASIIAALAANLFGFTATSHMVVLSFLLAMNLSTLKDRAETQSNKYSIIRIQPYGKFLLIISTILIITLPFPLVISKVKADYYFAEGYKGASMGEYYESLENMTKADSIYPYQNFYKYFTSNTYIQLSKKVWENPDFQSEVLDAALYYAEEGTKFSSSKDGLFHLSKAQIYAEYSYRPQAEEYKGKAMEAFLSAEDLMPLFPKLLFEKGEFLYNNEQYKESIATFEKYLDLSPHYWEYKEDLQKNLSDPKKFNEYRLFYKANPLFDEVFTYMLRAYKKTGNNEKAEYYEKLIL